MSVAARALYLSAVTSRRHVAPSRAPPQKNITIIIRAHPLRIPLKTTASISFPYFQA
jgi:hypothetical protein